MEIDRLKSEIWVQAQIRLCSKKNIAIYILKRGDPDAGAIIVRINELINCNTIYRQIRSISGEIVWSSTQSASTLSDEDSDIYLEKQKSIDPDLWILEIEDPDKNFRFNEPVL